MNKKTQNKLCVYTIKRFLQKKVPSNKQINSTTQIGTKKSAVPIARNSASMLKALAYLLTVSTIALKA